MAAHNTPIPDLIELSSINANATFTNTPGGGGDILGIVDNGTYTDGDGSNSSSQLAELNQGGILTIDGVDYSIMIAVPDRSSDDVTITYDDGGSSVDLGGGGFSSDVVFITASPLGGGANRFFAAIDDDVGDLPNITSIQTRDLDFDPSGNDVRIDLDQDQNVAPVCFTPGVLIETSLGPVAIEALQVGDQVLTLDGGPQPVRWIGNRTMTFGPEAAQHRPVQIKKGALGQGLPRRDMAVSPQHRMLIEGPVVRRLFGASQVLVRAKGMTGLRGVRVMEGKRQATYITFMLDRHHVIAAEGAPTESFHPGPTALQLLRKAQREEVESLFPQLRGDPETGYGPTARRVLTQRESKRLCDCLQRPERAEMQGQITMDWHPGILTGPNRAHSLIAHH